MTHKELQELIKLISKSNLTEFKMTKGDLKLSLRTKKYYKRKGGDAATPVVHVPATQPSAPAPAPQVVAPVPSHTPASTPAQPTSAAPEKSESNEESAGSSANMVEIKSPIVGTFYRSPSPDKPPFLKVGDRVEVGDVVCIVEAMKLFNEIESEIAGEVVKVFAEDASPVEYDQPLFLIDTSK